MEPDPRRFVNMGPGTHIFGGTFLWGLDVNDLSCPIISAVQLTESRLVHYQPNKDTSVLSSKLYAETWNACVNQHFWCGRGGSTVLTQILCDRLRLKEFSIFF